NGLRSGDEGDGPVGSELAVGLRQTVSGFKDGHGVRLTGEVQLRLCEWDQPDRVRLDQTGDHFTLCLHDVNNSPQEELRTGAHSASWWTGVIKCLHVRDMIVSDRIISLPQTQTSTVSVRGLHQRGRPGAVQSVEQR
ncbi:hypothetical protein INR49_020391, partial [Caranx melampygus]